MSEYYKAEDVINAIEYKIAEYIPTLYGRYAEIPLELRVAIEHLPTIEVSEDCISRDYVRLIESDEDAYYGDWNETYEKGFIDAINKVLNAPSVVPKDKCKVCQQYDIGFEDGGLDMLQNISNAMRPEGKNEQSD